MKAIFKESQLDIEIQFTFVDDKNYGMLLNGGIYVVTKGMPTGIVIEPQTTGFSGYWSNFIMLIEDDKITFDLGRKTIPSRTKGTLKYRLQTDL